MSLSLFHNQSSHSLGWWHHCLSATHVGSLLWPVLGARRHPWVWVLFRQVCIPDRKSKVMTDIPVWDTWDIYFSAMSDLAAQVSSRAWTCSPAIASYMQNCDSTAISGPLKPYVVWLDRDREVACSASDRQGSNFESCVWRTVSSQSSHHPQEVLLAQFSLYVHKGGLKPDSFHFLLLHICRFRCNMYLDTRSYVF